MGCSGARDFSHHVRCHRRPAGFHCIGADSAGYDIVSGCRGHHSKVRCPAFAVHPGTIEGWRLWTDSGKSKPGDPLFRHVTTSSSRTISFWWTPLRRRQGNSASIPGFSERDSVGEARDLAQYFATVESEVSHAGNRSLLQPASLRRAKRRSLFAVLAWVDEIRKWPWYGRC